MQYSRLVAYQEKTPGEKGDVTQNKFANITFELTPNRILLSPIPTSITHLDVNVAKSSL